MISFISLICIWKNIFLFKTSIRSFFMNSRRTDLRIGARHIMNGRIFGGVKKFLLELRQSLLVYFPLQNLVCSPKSHILIFALLIRIERLLISCPNLNSNHVLARYVFSVGFLNGDKLDSELTMWDNIRINWVANDPELFEDKLLFMLRQMLPSYLLVLVLVFVNAHQNDPSSPVQKCANRLFQIVNTVLFVRWFVVLVLKRETLSLIDRLVLVKKLPAARRHMLKLRVNLSQRHCLFG